MPFSTKEIEILNFDEIDKLYKEVFTEEFAKNFIQGKLISFKPMKIAGRLGFLVIQKKLRKNGNENEI